MRNVPPRRWVRLHVALGLLLIPLTGSTIRGSYPADDPRDGFQLLTQAAANDLRSDPAIPFHLHAKLLIWISGNKPVEGTYDVLWLSHENWREEIELPSYSRVRVWARYKMWQARSIPYEPERIFQLEHLVREFRRDLLFDPEDKIGKVSQHKANGLRADCMTIHPGFGTDREMCFDSVAGALISESISGGSEETREFGDYQTFYDKKYPVLMRLLFHDKPAVQVQVDKVEALSRGASIEPPGGAELWESCESPRAARRLDKTAPNYPGASRMVRHSGTVYLYGVIEADGTLSHLKIIGSAWPDLDSEAMDAARKFRYQPATCEGKPIRIETSIEMLFKLGN